MEIRGTFAELVAQCMDMCEPSDAEPMQLFVQDGPVVTCGTPAIICNEALGESTRGAPLERFRYVLMLCQVRQVLAKCKEDARGLISSDDACRAVMHFSEHDSYAPPESMTPGYRFIWKVGHKRGGAA